MRLRPSNAAAIALVVLAGLSEEQTQDPLGSFSPGVVGYLGGFPAHEIPGMLSARACAERCRATAGCASFMYSHRGALCTLSTGRAGRDGHELVLQGDHNYYGPNVAGTTLLRRKLQATVNQTVQGCMDPAATNYNPLATVQDGSCTYQSGHWGQNALNTTLANNQQLAQTMTQAQAVSSGRSGCSSIPPPCSNVTGLTNNSVLCVNRDTIEGFWCGDCPEGFVGNGQVCLDEDDCRYRFGTRWDPCGVNGSYVHPRAGDIGPAAADCRDAGLVAYECTCNAGFEWLGSTAPSINMSCVDVDDCGPRGVRGPDPCGQFAESCTDEGTNAYSCVCAPGYAWRDPLGACVEISPCDEGLDNCHDDAVCNPEGPGRYSCTCHAGFYGDGVNCSAFDACSVSGLHPRYAEAGNESNLMLGDTVNPRSQAVWHNELVPTSSPRIQPTDPCWSVKEQWRVACFDQPVPSWNFVCGDCPDGYPGDGIQCSDVDECSDWIRNCGGHGACHDRVYEYECSCDAGYSGSQCEVDDDECAIEPCANSGACVDSAAASIRSYSRASLSYLHSQHIRDLPSALSLAVGETSSEISIGFPFPFYGEARTSLVINGAGFVAFAPWTAPAACCVSAAIPAAQYGAVIAPYWDGSSAGAVDVRYGLLRAQLHPSTDPFADDSNRDAFAVSFRSVSGGVTSTWRLALFWGGDFHIVLDDSRSAASNVTIGWQSGAVDSCGVPGGDGSSCSSSTPRLSADCGSRFSLGAFAAVVAGRSVTVDCPSDCNGAAYSYSVWGHEPYRDDSSICAAALHSTGQNGGQFVLYAVAEHSPQNSSFANGVRTAAVHGGGRAFTVDVAQWYGQTLDANGLDHSGWYEEHFCTGSCLFNETVFHVRPERDAPVGGYACVCPAGFEGTQCERDTDECGSNPCLNGGHCTDSTTDGSIEPDRYSCSCEPGFANGMCSNYNYISNYLAECNVRVGGNCDIDVDECSSSPCQHNSACAESASSSSSALNLDTGTYVWTTVESINISYHAYRCSCQDGYTSGLCVYDFIPEYTAACTALESTASYPGNCEIDVDECASHPCQNQARCTDSNDVTCTVDGCGQAPVSVSNFSCACNPGYTNGACAYDYIAEYTDLCTRNETGICDMDLNECDSSPCVNGGECFDSTSVGFSIVSITTVTTTTTSVPIDEFTCACPDGYANGLCNSSLYASQYHAMCSQPVGGRCDVDVDECASQPCENSARCVSNTDPLNGTLAEPGTYFCLCVPGYANGVCDYDNIAEYDSDCNLHDSICDLDMDECRSFPCVNSAPCEDSTSLAALAVDRYRCLCTAGYTNGMCDYDYISEYTAQCTVRTGGFCEEDVDECQSNPCMNGASCEESIVSANVSVHAYLCKCGKSCPECPCLIKFETTCPLLKTCFACCAQ